MIVGECVVTVFSLHEHFTAHYSGLALHVVSGCIFMCLHAHISRKYPTHHTPCLVRTRISFSVIGCVFPTFYVLSRLLRFEEKYLVPEISVWGMQLLIHLYIASFTWDLGRARMSVDSLQLEDKRMSTSESSLVKEDLMACQQQGSGDERSGDENETIA